MLTIKDLSFSYTDRPLFENVTFRIPDGQKVGIVGPNGAGKTTLLGLLLGKGGQSSGKIEYTGTIAHVPQEIKYDPIMEKATSVVDYIDPQSMHEKHALEKLLHSLELKVKLDAAPESLSGGQKTRLALARALLQRPDILLLDEPTNFMDTAGKKWVMDFLSRYEGSVILISHDLALMDGAIDKILSLSPVTKSIDEYTGNYSQYLRLKAEKEKLLQKEIQVKKQHIARMEKGLAKMARANRFTGAKIKQLHRIEKAKEELPEVPPEIRKITINLPTPAPVGELPIKAVNIQKSYGDKVILKNVNFSIRRGERVSFIGPNGVGKSTFIKILIGMLEPDSGEVMKNDMLDIGYYSQEFETFDLSKNVLDTFVEGTHKDERFARAFLGRYMLSGDKVFQTVESLSGGEKTRLSIAILTGRNYNMLILDEPTTYLDVLSQRIILEALKEYKGTMIIVSHTPEFVSELAPKKAFLFPEEKEVFWDDSLVNKVEEL